MNSSFSQKKAKAESTGYSFDVDVRRHFFKLVRRYKLGEIQKKEFVQCLVDKIINWENNLSGIDIALLIQYMVNIKNFYSLSFDKFVIKYPNSQAILEIHQNGSGINSSNNYYPLKKLTNKIKRELEYIKSSPSHSPPPKEKIIQMFKSYSQDKNLNIIWRVKEKPKKLIMIEKDNSSAKKCHGDCSYFLYEVKYENNIYPISIKIDFNKMLNNNL